MSTRIITNICRFSFPSVFKPKAFDDDPDSKKFYEVTLMIPKSDVGTIQKIKDAINEATRDGLDRFWKGEKPKKFWNPLQDGDDSDRAEYADCYIIHAKSSNKPGVVDRYKNEILDPEEFYAGCYGRASITFYPFDNKTKGIGVGLNNIQKLKEGERFGADNVAAEDEFDDYEDEEDF